MRHGPRQRRYKRRPGAQTDFPSISWLLLILRTVEGFRSAFAPIQPVFSLCASSYGDKLSPKSNQQQPTFVDFPGGTLEFSWHASIADIPAKVWDGCLPNPADKKKTTGRSPFLEHSWLHSLEASGCVSEDTGWIPQHLSVHIHYSKGTKKETKDDKEKTTETVLMDGCVPVYIKTHSMGEFIFDDSWADAAFRNGLDYYPKLLVGVPFTPVRGPRILWHSQVWESVSSEAEMDELNMAVAKFLKQSASARGWSSVHINFCTNQEASAISNTLLLPPVIDEQSDNQEAALSDSRDGSTVDGSRDAESNVYFSKDDDTIATTNEGKDTKEGSNGDIGERLQAILTRQLEQNENNSYIRRTSLQYVWKNRNPRKGGTPFANFEDYLSCFKSKRRINIRRERAKALQEGKIKVEAISGADILEVSGLVERMFEIYMSTVDKMFWGRKYLTLEFFQLLCSTSFLNNIVFFIARYQTEKEDEESYDKDEEEQDNGITAKSNSWKAEDVFAGTFNVVKDGVFYGRYWGCLPGHDIKNLHFEICYWSAIDYCIENGLARMEPGAGGADYKWARGFDPQFVHSVHYICNPLLRRAVSQFVESETEYNVALKGHLLGRSAVAERDPQTGRRL